MNKTFLELKKNCKKDICGLTPISLAVLGDCATQFLSLAIKGCAYDEGYACHILDTGYDQIDAQVFDESSELYANRPSVVLILMCSEKLYSGFCATPAAHRKDFADRTYARIRNYWESINAHLQTKIIQFTFAETDDGVFGNFASKTDSSFLYQVKRLNYLLMDGLREMKNAYPVDMNRFYMQMGRSTVRDDKFYYSAKMTLSVDILPAVAEQVVRVIQAIGGHLKKCVVFDLDNTIWGGVIGDDGLEHIEIGEYGRGRVFSDIQQWLKELKNRGVILGVCSKNEEGAAKEPFLKHPNMILALDDISVFMANWEDKSANIRAIQQVLNIGMDSIVFLDDNPFERNAVKSMIADVTVPELPEDPANYLSYLQHLNLFETATFSNADKDRTAQYQIEAERVRLQAKFASYDDYLESLEMVAQAKPFDSFHIPRIAQLTQRSNQFNLRTVRYTEAEIEAIIEDPQYIPLYFTLKDKFGDHGLISVMILKKTSDKTLFIHEWLMSCRVLKRGMEEFVVNKCMQTAKQQGFATIIGEYIKTPKNAPVAELYQRMGFDCIGKNTYAANVNSFQTMKTFVKELFNESE